MLPDSAPSDDPTYWGIVAAQFRKNRVASLGLWGIIATVGAAIAAPLICLDIPFWIRTVDGAGRHVTEFPWFSALLFDRNLFENGVDVFFNLLLVLSPLMLLTAFGVRQWRRGEGPRRRGRGLRHVLVVWAALISVAFIALLANPISRPYRDYRAELSATEQTPGEAAEALFPPIPLSFRKPDLDAVLSGPSATHLLGTDDRGRDVFARLLYGTRISLTIGAVAVSIYISIGLLLGALAGYYRGWVDALILRLIEVMLCFPSFILILTLVAFIDEPSIFHVMLVIGLTRWTGVARLTRGEFLRLGSQDFVAAAVASGVSEWRVIFRHILPNAVSPMLVAATFGVASAILIESALSFLGLGDPSAPSWGEVLNIGRQTEELRMILAPGVAIFVTVSLFNLVGEGIRDALDPKLRR